MTRVGAVAAWAVLALVLSGCMRMHTALSLNSDDTVDGSMVMAISDEAAADAGMTPDELWEQMGTSLTEDLPDGITVEPYAEDGYTGQTFVFENTPLSETSSTGLTVTREGDEFVVSGEMDLTEDGLDDQGGSGLDTADLASTLDIQMTVTFPGAVTETNGERSGNTVTWIAVYGEVLSIEARGDATGTVTTPADPADDATDGADGADGADGTDATDGADGSDGADADSSDAEDSDGAGWILWASIGAGALALVGLVLWLVLRNRGSRGAGGPGGPENGAGPGGYGGYGAPQGWAQGNPGQAGHPQGQGGQQPAPSGQQPWGQQPPQPGPPPPPPQQPGPWG